MMLPFESMSKNYPSISADLLEGRLNWNGELKTEWAVLVSELVVCGVFTSVNNI